jgi:hypothetical protein
MHERLSWRSSLHLRSPPHRRSLGGEGGRVGGHQCAGGQSRADGLQAVKEAESEVISVQEVTPALAVSRR